MATRTPSAGRIAAILVFALSCLGLLLFLWVSFGGTIPLNPQGYRIRIAFPYADELAITADVRVSGVSVGKVVSKSLDPTVNRTVATIEIDSQFAPIHRDTRAILREKTIVGETYVELTPGTPGSPTLPDGAMLPVAQVQPAVQLGQILDTFDPRTRNAFQIWQQQLAEAVGGNGENLNNTLGNLPAFAHSADDLLGVLDIERGAVDRLVGGGATTFSALSSDQRALRGLITSSRQTFATTAAQSDQLAASFHVFPTFLDETRATMTRLKSFALDANPVIKKLEPVAIQLTPTLDSIRTLSPDLHSLFVELGPLVTVSQTGLPALRDVLTGTKPLLGALGPFLEELNPILDWLSLHQQLTSDFISLAATASAATTDLIPGETGTGHYLRSYAPTDLTAFSNPATVPNPDIRGDTYPGPLWLANTQTFSAGGRYPGSFALGSWSCATTSSGGPQATILSKSPPEQACAVAGTLPGARSGQIPRIRSAHYPGR